MSQVPIIIVSRDRLTPLRQLIEWLVTTGHRLIHILDNDSSYEPLLTYLDSLPTWIDVHHLKHNFGSYAPWTTRFVVEHFPDEPYVVTDPDVVPDTNCPVDLLSYLLTILQRHPERIKIGLGLRIDDIPDSYRNVEAVKIFESEYWKHEIEPGLFEAEVDTTFALYRAGVREFARGPALRTGPPYIACHLGWYSDSANPTSEELFYRNRANPQWATWNGGTDRPRWLSEAVHIRATGGRGIRSRVYKAFAWKRRWEYYPRAFWEWQIVKRLARLRSR